jgi:hypothetical protein
VGDVPAAVTLTTRRADDEGEVARLLGDRRRDDSRRDGERRIPARHCAGKVGDGDAVDRAVVGGDRGRVRGVAGAIGAGDRDTVAQPLEEEDARGGRPGGEDGEGRCDGATTACGSGWVRIVGSTAATRRRPTEKLPIGACRVDPDTVVPTTGSSPFASRSSSSAPCLAGGRSAGSNGTPTVAGCANAVPCGVSAKVEPRTDMA